MTESLSSTTYDNLSPNTGGLAPLERLAGRPFAPLERRKRVSHSIIWQLLRRFYAEQGVRAWGAGGIPFHVTSNPYIAGAYARVLLAFMRDAERAGGGVDVVELGAGHGRFAYLLLRALTELCDRSSLAGLPLRYVITDLAEKNLEHLRAHSRLAPFVERGILHFARYEIGRDREIALADGPISAARPSEHLAVVANYVLDSLPQDVFSVRAGRLHETLISVDLDGDLDDPGALARAHASYHESLAPDGYYGDPDWDALLAGYAERLPECSFQVPITALGSIRDLRASAQKSFLLLSADKGYTSEEELLAGYGAPNMVAHNEGCFSISVNYHAIGAHFVRTGGEALHPHRGHESINVSAFLAGAAGHAFTETRAAYDAAVRAFGPDDMATAMSAIAGHHEGMSFSQNLALLRLAGYDLEAFLRCAPGLAREAPAATETERRSLRHAVHAVWDEYFPLGEPFDLPFQLGELLYLARYFADAISFFEQSIELFGESPGALHDIGLCHHYLGASDAALASFQRALALDPDHEPARAMRIKLEAAAARR